MLSAAQDDILIIPRSPLALFMLILISFLMDSLESMTTPRSISSEQRRICALLVLELCFLGYDMQGHDYILLI